MATIAGKADDTMSLMIQGVGSNVGKSVICAGLCRLFANEGWSVAPFKPQNMSNNAAVAAGGREIGRAQYLQAMACRVEPTADMNPVLLKPESESGAQVIVNGKALGSFPAAGYSGIKSKLLPEVINSYNRLSRQHQVIICEGAGSPAETNLRKDDIANMGFASATDIPVVLLGDIDRGGVIASLVGTWSVLEQGDREQIKGFMINKFRGDPGLFSSGYSEIEARTGWQGLGILPWFNEAHALPAEDSVGLYQSTNTTCAMLHVCCLALNRIANFDDLDPMRLHPDVSFSMIRPGVPIPGDAGLVIVPGSKSTRSDLEFIRNNGWDIDLHAHIRRGGSVLGICGGFQILGRSIHDPDGVDGMPGMSEGLGFLDIETMMHPDKRVATVTASDPDRTLVFNAYEIHMGRSCGIDCNRPFAMVQRGRYGWQPEGARSACGKVHGTYLHGLFSDNAFRKHYLDGMCPGTRTFDYLQSVDKTLDLLAGHISRHVDINGIRKIMQVS